MDACACVWLSPTLSSETTANLRSWSSVLIRLEAIAISHLQILLGVISSGKVGGLLGENVSPLITHASSVDAVLSDLFSSRMCSRIWFLILLFHFDCNFILVDVFMDHLHPRCCKVLAPWVGKIRRCLFIRQWTIRIIRKQWLKDLRRLWCTRSCSLLRIASKLWIWCIHFLLSTCHFVCEVDTLWFIHLKFWTHNIILL